MFQPLVGLSVYITAGRAHIVTDCVRSCSETENSPRLPAVSSHFSVLRSLVFLFMLLSSISGRGTLINGNTESNLPVIH